MEVRIENVSLKRTGVHISIDAVFHPGIHLLTGRVGSGKSTIGLLISQALKPDSGEIRLFGVKKSVLLMQNPEHHLTALSVESEILSWGASPDQVLTLSGLSKKADADILTLSRGELKRLELAAILSGSYDLILLDEPFAGLDLKGRRAFADLIKERSEGIVLIISHDISFLPPIDHLWRMKEGRLEDLGELPESLMLPGAQDIPLIRALTRCGIRLNGLSREDIEEGVCRIQG